ncbi:HlyD family efflux transporter periplasmic adaptor subunit [Steroidobacter sp.]|uniref:HlyD family efflux transporter periplasmic adaptor subunit n=1 Tax=Steroidobacter sp. TaxID=1978227 RepID=UPI001A61E65E|nr:HlyD family efflux transporter periplasmic adaptor subunit [Steroidobacter sp.]MBL8266139.1 HlyD family efflux transporter periplasmic adaptor subunit [Steroidobacter sp.]
MRLAADLSRYRQLHWLVSALLLATVVLTGLARFIDKSDATAVSTTNEGPRRNSITAPGRVQPLDGVIDIAAPSFEAGHAIVTELLVKRGDWVKQGQVLATLRGRAELEAALAVRERKLAVAKARLAALKAGGKADDVDALRAEVLSDETSLAYVEAETQRVKKLQQDRMVSLATLEAQESRLAVATQALQAKRARLSSLSTVRPADLAVADAECRAAESEVQEIRSRLEATVVRAPADGRILQVHAHPGQSVGTAGVLSFGRTSEMFVAAEVMEEDIGRARVGQKVTITGDALPEAVSGTVDDIGYLVGARETFRNDPTAFIDSRVVQVRVRADRPEQLERFINARVTVAIQQ